MKSTQPEGCSKKHLDKFMQEKATHGDILKLLQLRDLCAGKQWGKGSSYLQCPCAPAPKEPQQAAKGAARSLISWNPIKSLLTFDM